LSDNYYYLVYAALTVGFLFIFLKKYIKNAAKYLKYPAFIIFLPFILLPLLRCYFSIPYLFCRICPKKCPWGVLRPVIIPGFLVLNLDLRFWCFRLCPFGTLQDLQCKISGKRLCLPGWIKHIRYLFLAFSIVILIGIIRGHYFNFFGKNSYEYTITVLAASSIIFILSFFIPRFFCNHICPVGAFSHLALKIENKIMRKFK